MSRIYLDYAATAPLCEAAREAMMRWIGRTWGNPSSLHEEGRRAKQALDEARERISARLGCLFAEVVFTSGGTEACNLAILGSALSAPVGLNRILMSATEHPAVLDTRKTLSLWGFEVVLIPVDSCGMVSLDTLRSECDSRTLLVCVMHANNETGVIQPVATVAEIAHSVGARLFVDACQTFCKLDWTVDSLGADLLALSAQKHGGPQGAGALYVRSEPPRPFEGERGQKVRVGDSATRRSTSEGTLPPAGETPPDASCLPPPPQPLSRKAGEGLPKLHPLLLGGDQERELRAGTENVAAIAGFGASIRDYSGEVEGRLFRQALSRHLGDQLIWTLDDSTQKLDSLQHCRFPGIKAESLLIRLDRNGIAASAGAACGAGSIEPSPVLIAMSWSEKDAKEAVRFSFGPGLSTEAIERAAQIIAETVTAIRQSQR